MIGLMVLSAAFAQDRNFDGSISVTGILSEVNGSKAKFNEYRDTKSGGVYGDIRLGYDSGSYYTNLRASEMGYDTQNYKLDGGMWGKFKYNLFYNEIPHNITNDARSFYSGIGSANLTGAANTSVSTWNKFDYFTERQQYGGGLRFDLTRPFYIDVSFAREERDGVKPAGVNLGSPGGAILELPEPIDYITNTFKTEIGYIKRPVFASLNFTISNFDNDHDILSFTHPTTGTTDRLSLPPDNESYKIGFKGGLNLPMNSKLNVNLSASKNRSDATLIRFFVFEGEDAEAKQVCKSFVTGELFMIPLKVEGGYHGQQALNSISTSSITAPIASHSKRSSVPSHPGDIAM